MLRSLSGVRSISSSMPATEILPRGAAALLCGSLTASRTLPAKASPAELPHVLVHSHRAAGRRASQAAGGRSCQVPGLAKKRPSNVDLTSRWMRTTCGRSWRTGPCKARRSRSMPWRAGDPRRLMSQMRGRRLPLLLGAVDSGGHDGGLHVSLRRLVGSCARHLRCASRVSSRCGSRNGAGVFNHCADARRGVGPSITGADAVPRGALALRRVARVRACTGRLRPACRCSPSSLPNPVAWRGLLTHDLFDGPVCWGLGRLGLDGASDRR
jgi:hypothetical protein